MECRDITESEFEIIFAELQFISRRETMVESITGEHAIYGSTVLVRDASRCMALVEHPAGLDRFLAKQAFVSDGATARVAGRG